MPLFVRKSHDLVFEGGAISRTNPLDLAVEQRRLIDVRENETANPLVCVQKVAGRSWPIDSARREGKRHRHIVAKLFLEATGGDLCVEVNARPVKPRRCAGLQTAPLKSE